MFFGDSIRYGIKISYYDIFCQFLIDNSTSCVEEVLFSVGNGFVEANWNHLESILVWTDQSSLRVVSHQ